MAASDYFEGVILFGKAGLMLLLFILAYINAYTSFINKRPRRFLTEAFLTGLLSALSFVFIGMIRIPFDTGRLVSIALMSFLIFFVLDVLMELSGVNQAFVNPSALNPAMKKEEKILSSKASLFTGLAIIIIMVGLAAWNSFTTFDPAIPIPQLGMEAGVFGFLNALPTVMLAVDRGEKNPNKIAKSTLGTFGALVGGHVLLQAGGFYKGIF
jgi:hypothetical protein